MQKINREESGRAFNENSSQRRSADTIGPLLLFFGGKKERGGAGEDEAEQYLIENAGRYRNACLL